MSLVYKNTDQPQDYYTATYPFFGYDVELPESRQRTDRRCCLTLLGERY